MEETYQTRVIQEKEELDKKIANLQRFIEFDKRFNDININEEKRDLRDQLHSMERYSNILGSRINRFSYE